MINGLDQSNLSYWHLWPNPILILDKKFQKIPTRKSSLPSKEVFRIESIRDSILDVIEIWMFPKSLFQMIGLPDVPLLFRVLNQILGPDDRS